MPETRRHRILIVDDERDNVELIARIFRREFEVEFASDAREALSRIESNRFDVIITDQMMPGMTGVELLRRSLDLSPDAIRIVITGFPDLETAINSVNRGRVFRFFTKPLDREELFAAVTQALRAAEVGAASRRAAIEALPPPGPPPGTGADLETLVAARTLSLSREIERLRDKVDRDPDLGILSARAIRERLEEEAIRAERFALPLSLLSVRVAPSPPRPDATPSSLRAASQNPFLGPLKVVVEIVEKSGRRFDLIGRAAEDAVVLLLPHTDAAGAAARSDRLLRGMTATRYLLPRIAHVTRGADGAAQGLWEAALAGVGVTSL
jgi:PleD family two-component response regulator